MQRKGKKKNFKKKNTRRDLVSYKAAGEPFGHLPKPKYTLLTPDKIYRWPFKPTAYFGRSLVPLSSFQSKSGTGISGDQLTHNSGAAYGWSFAFAIADIDEWGNLGTLFDQFILHRIRLRIKPLTGSTTGVVTSAALAAANMYVVVDYDSTTAPANTTAARDFANVQEFGAYQGIVVDFVPGVRIPSVTGNITSPPMWQDCATGTNLHLGVKGYLSLPSNTSDTWLVEAQYCYGFRNKI